MSRIIDHLDVSAVDLRMKRTKAVVTHIHNVSLIIERPFYFCSSMLFTYASYLLIISSIPSLFLQIILDKHRCIIDVLRGKINTGVLDSASRFLPIGRFYTKLQ